MNKQTTAAKSGNGGTVTKDQSTGSAEGTSPTGTTTANASGGADSADGGKPAEPEAPKDPFEGIPTVKLHEAEVRDLSGQETSLPRKYAKVAEAAAQSHMPVMAGWKYEQAVFVLGTNRQERKPTSVWGTIIAAVQAAGRAGINAYDLAAIVRVNQIGNKRSHYCEKLPPVGWAEGWINSAVSRGLIAVHASKKAPALRPEQTAAKDSQATEQQNKAAQGASEQRTGTNG